MMRERVAPAAEPPDRARRDGGFTMTMPAAAAELGPMRRELVAWARRQGGSDTDVADLQLAVSEAVANGVEHAYRGGPPGTVDVVVTAPGGEGERMFVARVADRGSWRRPVADNGYRGRGLAMIRALARNVSITRSAHGTVVSFELPLGGAPRPDRSAAR